jgi:hypothetical protein
MKHFFVVALTVAGVAAGSAQADQIFTTGPGATEPGNNEAISAMADFSLVGSTLTLTLTNTLANIHDAGQLLTGIFFTLSSGSATLSSETGPLVKLASGGVVTPTGSTNLAWGFGTDAGSWELCTICQGSVTGAAPTEGILGVVSADGKYDNANPSLTNGSHSPFVENQATFIFTGLASGVTVDNVRFAFSTTPGDIVAAVPEPSSLGSLAAGLLGLAAFRRRKQ